MKFNKSTILGEYGKVNVTCLYVLEIRCLANKLKPHSQQLDISLSWKLLLFPLKKMIKNIFTVKKGELGEFESDQKYFAK